MHIPETDHKSIGLTISFEIEEKDLNLRGVIVWMKEKGADNDYGIKFSADESTKKELVEILKLYSKNAKHSLDRLLMDGISDMRFVVKVENDSFLFMKKTNEELTKHVFCPSKIV